MKKITHSFADRLAARLKAKEPKPWDSFFKDYPEYDSALFRYWISAGFIRGAKVGNCQGFSIDENSVQLGRLNLRLSPRVSAAAALILFSAELNKKAAPVAKTEAA